jgi:DNA-binding NarL/FixJ family response regulator
MSGQLSAFPVLDLSGPHEKRIGSVRPSRVDSDAEQETPHLSPPAGTPAPVRVVAIDDHPAVRAAIKTTIQSQPDMEFCGVADSASGALKLIGSTQPDVAVLDLNLGEESGLDLLEDLRRRFPGTRVVVFSMYDATLYAERALAAGASVYVMKSESTRAIANAIRNAAGREQAPGSDSPRTPRLKQAPRTKKPPPRTDK